MEVLYVGSKYAVGPDSLFESVEEFLRVSNKIMPTHTQDGTRRVSQSCARWSVAKATVRGGVLCRPTRFRSERGVNSSLTETCGESPKMDDVNVLFVDELLSFS